MENILLNQLYSFFIYLISGILIGIFFDIFRILRKSFHTPDFITYIEDIVFWVFTGLFLLFVLFFIGNGEIRLYNIIGLLTGSIIYLLTISKYFINISVCIVTFMKNIIYKIIKILLYPINIILKICRKIFSPFTFFVINTKKILYNNVKKINNKQKNNNKMKKMARERRILERNVEKYN